MSIEIMDAIELQREAEDYFNGLSFLSYLQELQEEKEGEGND